MRHVKRYILIHDTEEPTCPGMFPAVEDYLLDNPQWELERREKTRPGLTVLKRISDGRVTSTAKLHAFARLRGAMGEEALLSEHSRGRLCE
jgi:hypothetical protein